MDTLLQTWTRNLEEIEDILEEPPMERKYERVRMALIKRLSNSTSHQFVVFIS